MSAALLASPVNQRPTLRIGGEANPAIDTLLQSFAMREAVGGLSSLEATFSDWAPAGADGADFAFSAGSVLQLGAEVTAYAGPTSSPREIFRGVVSALEFDTPQDGSPQVTLLAEDKLQAARKTRRSRVFTGDTPAGIVRAIAREHQLTAAVRDGLDMPVSDWTQINQSDLAFLREVMDAVDADIQVVAGELQAGPRAGAPRSTLELRLHDNLLSVSIIADLADQATEVRVSGFDPASGESVDARAASGALGPGRGITGPSLVARTFGGARVETIGHCETTTQAEAKARADAGFRKRARRFVQATGQAAGDPALRVGTHVELKRVSPLVAGTYVVTEAAHLFDQRGGYLTRFSAESAYFGGGA